MFYTEFVLISTKHLYDYIIVDSTYYYTASSILESRALFDSLRTGTRLSRLYMKSCIKRGSDCSLIEY